MKSLHVCCSVLCYSAEFSDCSSRVASICRLEPLQYCCRTCSGLHTAVVSCTPCTLGRGTKFTGPMSQKYPNFGLTAAAAAMVLRVCCSGCKLSSARLASQLAGLQSAAAAVVLQSRCSPAHMQPAACSSPGPGTRPNCTNAAENVQCPQCRARGSAGWRGRAAAGPGGALRNCSLEIP